MATPPRGRAERLKLGLPCYVNRSTEPLSEERRLPQVDEPARAVVSRKSHPHAAPGAFEIPEDVEASAELVVAAAQDGFNRWLDNISNQISHKNRDMGPLHIDLLDMQSLRRTGPLIQSTRI